MVVELAVTCRVRPAKQQECWAAFERLIARARNRTGCLDARLSVDPTDPHALTLRSEWATRTACDAYVTSGDFGVVRGMRFLMTSAPVMVVRSDD